MTVHDETFDSMGSAARLVVEGPSAARAAAGCRAFLEDFEARLSRFREDSELCHLNRARASEVEASSLLRATKIVNCHQTVVELSLRSAMTAVLAVVQIFARAWAHAPMQFPFCLLDFCSWTATPTN